MGAAKRFTQNPGRNAICYYRYSSDAQRDVSIEQQQEAAAKYAKDHGLRIIKEYADRAVSGTRDDRVEYNLMLYEAEMLRPAYLILWKTDRLSRDRYDSVIAKSRLRSYGVKIVYTAESIPDDDEATQILLESLYEGIAASFIESHRKNVMRGMNYNAEKCLYNGALVFGYHGEPDKPYEIDPNTGPIALQIFQDYADGVPMKKIIDDLNGKGIRNAHGRPFSLGTIRSMLTNKAYIGVYKWGSYETVGGMPQLVPDELFEKAAARLESNRHTGKGTARLGNEAVPDYWLTGCLYCGLCGGTMQGTSGTSKTGAKHYYYSCINHRKHSCPMKSLPKDLLERIVTDVLEGIVRDPAYRIMIAHACYEKYKSRNASSDLHEKSIREQLKDTQSRIAKLLDLMETGNAAPSMMERLNVLDAEKSRLEDALAMERNIQRFHISEAHILKYLDSMGGDPRDPETRRWLLDEYVSRVAVTGDTMAVSLHYIDDRREFSIRKKAEELDARDELMALLNDPGRLNELEMSDAAQEMLDSIIDPDDNPDDDPDDDPPSGGGPSGSGPSGGSPSGGRFTNEHPREKSKALSQKWTDSRTRQSSTSSWSGPPDSQNPNPLGSDFAFSVSPQKIRARIPLGRAFGSERFKAAERGTAAIFS